MINSPLITIAILNYNGLKYLKRVIPFLLKLDYPNYEIVIVDNASDNKRLVDFQNMALKKVEDYDWNVVVNKYIKVL